MRNALKAMQIAKAGGGKMEDGGGLRLLKIRKRAWPKPTPQVAKFTDEFVI